MNFSFEKVCGENLNFFNTLNAELIPICNLLALLGKGKGKSVPLQALTCPEGPRMLTLRRRNYFFFNFSKLCI